MSICFAFGKIGWFAAGAFLLVCIAVSLCFLLNPRDPDPVLILHQPFKMPLPLRDQLLRFIPGAASSAWGWGLGNALFGQRMPVNIYGDIIALPDFTRQGVVSSLPVERPIFSDSKGLEVWFLTNKDIQAVRQQFKQTPGIEFLEHPRMSMADGIQASLFSGQLIPLNTLTNEVGLRVEYFTRVRRHSTDLIGIVTLSEVVTNRLALNTGVLTNIIAIHTNLSLAARLQIPKGRGVLLVKPAANDKDHRSFGLIIEPP